jgi:hypothetical protein
MEQILDPDVRAGYAQRGRQRTEALSPAACADALTGFLAGHLGLGT